MPTLKIELENENGITANMSYSKEPDEGGSTTLKFSSSKLLGSDGHPINFSLSFRNIGGTMPGSFYAGLDKGYLNDKTSGLTGRRVDVMETIRSVRAAAADPDAELSAEDINQVEENIDASLRTFEGNHFVTCEIILMSLHRLDLPVFSDDLGSLVGYAETPEARIFHMEVWPDMIDALYDFYEENPEMYEKTSKLNKGLFPQPDPDIDYSPGAMEF